jgi:hypothetical protein
VRQYLPEPIDLIWRREIGPGKGCDLQLPLEDAAEGYRAMDERRHGHRSASAAPASALS